VFISYNRFIVRIHISVNYNLLDTFVEAFCCLGRKLLNFLTFLDNQWV